MKLNLNGNNTLDLFNLTSERADKIQDVLEKIVIGDEIKTEFSLKELIEASINVSKTDEEFGFCLVCIGRYMVEAEHQQEQIKSGFAKFFNSFQNLNIPKSSN